MHLPQIGVKHEVGHHTSDRVSMTFKVWASIFDKVSFYLRACRSES